MTVFTYLRTDEAPAEPNEIKAHETQSPFAQWVIIELFGHRRLGGWLTEQELAGQGFLRLDVPGEDSTNAVPVASQLYNPKSVYCITPTTEAMARAVAARSQPEPVHRWELPAAPAREDVEEYDPEPASSFPHDGGPF